ncbi:hypothetical protein K438DRAFT_1769781 [Mycena galopus ATCC 62051]|nr:hypothetical protein K438DRAFT_1769781 [Mycena galopus ATCC 62051]
MALTIEPVVQLEVEEPAKSQLVVHCSCLKTGPARFSLEVGFLIRTERTISEMQELLRQSSSLVAERTSCFCVDPHRILVTVLRSANSLGELQASWSALTERLSLAHRNFEKYQSEFQATSEEGRLLSPVSTLPELYNVFPRNATPASNVDYLYANIPHHQKQRPSGYSPHTDMVHDHIEVPGYLKRAFPDRPAETRPATVYYSSEGERRENFLPEGSSYRSAAEFVVPAPSGKGKSKLSSQTQRATVKEVEDESETTSRRRLTREDPYLQSASAAPSHWEKSTVILGSEIPFKSAQQFFVPRSSEGEKSPISIPGKPMPNYSYLKQMH